MVERPADEFSATARSIGDQFLPRHLGVDFGVSRQPARNVYQLKGEPSGCRKCAKAASRGVFERQLADLMRGTGRFKLLKVWLLYRPGWAQLRAMSALGLLCRFSVTRSVYARNETVRRNGFYLRTR